MYHGVGGVSFNTLVSKCTLLLKSRSRKVEGNLPLFPDTFSYWSLLEKTQGKLRLWTLISLKLFGAPCPLGEPSQYLRESEP